MKKFICCAAVLLLGVSLSAATLFKDGERAVFFGDSITSQGVNGYLSYMTTLYHSHYPGSVNIYCAGIPGDSAFGGLRSLKLDVLDRKPTRVFVWFGGNDLRYNLYLKGGKKLSAQQVKAFETCKKNLVKIYDQLQRAGVKAVAVTPSPFFYFNGEKSNFNEDGLAKLSAFIIKTAKERKMEYIDLYTPMYEAMKKNPEIEAYYKDKVHPNALGQLMIAYCMLKQMDFDGTVADVEIDAAGAKTVKAKYAEIRDLQKTAKGIRFTYVPERLPFVYKNTSQRNIDRLFPFSKDINNENLCVKGLAAGKYRLIAGKRTVGTFTAEELAKGINLAVLPTPSADASRRLDRFCRQIGNAQGNLRNIRQGDRLIGFGKVPKDPAERDKAIDAKVKKINSKYYYAVAKNYKKNFREEAKLTQLVERLMSQVRKNCVPQAFAVSIERAAK